MDKKAFLNDLKRLVDDLEAETQLEGEPDWKKIRLKANELIILVNTVLEHDNPALPYKPVKKTRYGRK